MGGRKQMERDLLIIKNKVLKGYLTSKKRFQTNTLTSSHQGGVWECRIRTIRSILNGMPVKYSQFYQIEVGS